MKKLTLTMLVASIIFGCGESGSKKSDSAWNEEINYKIDSTRSSDSLAFEQQKMLIKEHVFKWKLTPDEELKLDSLSIDDYDLELNAYEGTKILPIDHDSLVFFAKLKGTKFTYCSFELWIDNKPVKIPAKYRKQLFSNDGTLTTKFNFR